MSKQFWAIIIVIAVLVSGIFVLNNNKEEATSSAVEASSHTRGSGDLTLVEYGDFQCPACAGQFPLVEEITSQYSDQVTFQFRHFPLTQIHPNAFAASRAAEAAGMQDKFWEMYAALYSSNNWNGWINSQQPLALFKQYAAGIGLDAAKFEADFSSTTVNDTVRADLRAGQDAGVTGTPTFFLNGERLENSPTTLDEWKKVLDDALAKQATAS